MHERSPQGSGAHFLLAKEEPADRHRLKTHLNPPPPHLSPLMLIARIPTEFFKESSVMFTFITYVKDLKLEEKVNTFKTRFFKWSPYNYSIYL